MLRARARHILRLHAKAHIFFKQPLLPEGHCSQVCMAPLHPAHGAQCQPCRPQLAMDGHELSVWECMTAYHGAA